MTGSEETLSFRLAYVPGVTPTKWVRIWNERLPGIPLELVATPPAEAYDVLRDGGADAGFVRLPADRTFFSAIPLYTETTVVVVPKDHLFTAADEVSLEDLADEVVLHPLDDTLGWERPPGQPAFERPATTADAIELVAAGIGLLVVPQSLARLHHRKDLKYRTLTDAPQSQVALAWPEERTTDQVEDFIGIVRGRTVNSSRGRTQAPAPAQSKSKQPAKAGARQKPAARKPAARKPAGKGTRSPRGGSGAPKGAKRGKPRR
ncbi:LysR substrate-binding domain-containing protein [Streptomyces sp. NPDC026294]|uniref:LysR family transcriptional regulator substrate-binding protein n=1 Tax=Streptomyces sp. NPDC026294 TaxID=3155362 RepID=UPI003408EB0B